MSPAPPMSPPQTTPFLFPSATSTVLPDPSLFFSPNLLSSPLPTNSFFQNFTLKNGDVPEYIHPYLIKPSLSSLSLSYPSRISGHAFLYQVFTADLTVSAATSPPGGLHVISSYSDLSVTLDFPSSNLRFFLVRGSPYLTCSVVKAAVLSISTVHAVVLLFSDASQTKHTVKLSNNQTWIIYTSSPATFRKNPGSVLSSCMAVTSDVYVGIVRIAVLPNPDYEPILDRFSSCYPVSGCASLSKPFCMEYHWEKKGGDLLMLAHPLHLKLLNRTDEVMVIDRLRYDSIDGELVGVVGDSWVLNTDPVLVRWHSVRGIGLESRAEIVSALYKDVEGLDSGGPITTSLYFYGKLIARAARLAIIAEEVELPEVVPRVRQFLRDRIEPLLDGTFDGNGFLYDKKWGGIVTRLGLVDSRTDFGFGVYNNHHYHLGYFIYAIAVLARIEPAWGRKYRAQAYSLVADFMNFGRLGDSKYPRLRCFDLYKLHSWAGGLTVFNDGRNQQSTSEAVNGYYSAALLGLAYEDSQLVSVGSMLALLEIEAAKAWWHVKEGDCDLYGQDFVSENRVVGVLWANKRDSGLWFARPDWRECRLGIQLLPLLPITEVLFSDVEFVKQLVNWAGPALGRPGVGEGWKGFVYALQGVYDKAGALEKVRNLNGFDNGNSLSNLLWWIHSRCDEEDGGKFG